MGRNVSSSGGGSTGRRRRRGAIILTPGALNTAPVQTGKTLDAANAALAALAATNTAAQAPTTPTPTARAPQTTVVASTTRPSAPAPGSFTDRLLDGKVKIKKIGNVAEASFGDSGATPRAVRNIFGKDLTPNQIAEVIGAPRGSSVFVSSNGSSHELSWTVSHPDIRSYDGTISKTQGGAHIHIGRMFMQYDRIATGGGLGSSMGLGIVANSKKYGVVSMDTTGAGSGAHVLAARRSGSVAVTGYSSWAELGGKGNITPSIQSRLKRNYNMTATNTHELLAKYGDAGMAAWKKEGEETRFSWDFRKNSPHVALMAQRLDRLGRRLEDR
jgi:hypothetical protein